MGAPETPFHKPFENFLDVVFHVLKLYYACHRKGFVLLVAPRRLMLWNFKDGHGGRQAVSRLRFRGQRPALIVVTGSEARLFDRQYQLLAAKEGAETKHRRDEEGCKSSSKIVNEETKIGDGGGGSAAAFGAERRKCSGETKLDGGRRPQESSAFGAGRRTSVVTHCRISHVLLT